MLLKKTLFTFLLLFSVVTIAQPPSAEQMEAAREHFNAGVKHGIDYNYEEAIKEFDKAIDLNPLYAEAFLYKGLAKIELEDNSQAIKDLTITIELDPAFSDQAHYFRGLAKYNLEDYSGSIDDLTIAIRMNPDYVAFFQRGKANLKLKEYKRSLQDFEISIRLQSDFYEAYLYRGINHYYMDKLEEAIEDLEIAKRYLPNSAVAYYYSGLARTGIRNSYVAIEDLNKAIELNPSYASAYEARAVAQTNTGNLDSARKDKEQAQLIQQGVKIGGEEMATSPGFTGSAHNEGDGISRLASATDINFAELFSGHNKTDEQPDKSENLHQLIASDSESQIHVVSGSLVNSSNSSVSISDTPSGIYTLSMEKIEPAGFGIQVASYTNTENLIRLAKAYEEKYSVPVVISIATLNNRKVYRLIIGKHANRVSAEQFRDMLRKDGFPDAYLVLFDNL
jgi:tetratricopeptide (TPR) repeat protein